jgi:cystathionine gamma-synthase
MPHSFRPLPLGHPIPDRPHAISVSLPTLADVIGYEERRPEVLRQVATGYPRFVLHPYVRAFTAEFARRHRLSGHSVWIVPSRALAEQLVAWLGEPAPRLIPEGRWWAVAFPEDRDRETRAKTFLQHTGGFISSREAEDVLVSAGLVPAPAPEETVDDQPAVAVRRALVAAYGGAGPHDLFLAANGMNAIHAAFGAVEAVQRPRGRTRWLQLGWIYLDTIAILQKFTAAPDSDHLVLANPCDLTGLRELMAAHRAQLAAVVAEVPSNPLVQTPAVESIAELCRVHGVHLLLDASIASPFNVAALRHADIALASLTKYAASGGDLLMGSAAINPAGPDAEALRAAMAPRILAPYRRDLARLAFEIRSVDRVVAAVNAATPRVVEFLRSRPEVRRVYWALQDDSAAAFRCVARAPDAVGCMVSFELQPGLFQPFYDRVPLAKGPSFGIETTLLCPFLYLAHYDLVATAAGRARLARHGISHELLRLSVGTEPAEEIIAALAEALDAARLAQA